MTEPINYASPHTPKPKRDKSVVGWFLFVGLAVLLFIRLKQSAAGSTPVPFSTFQREISKGNVSFVTLDGDDARGAFRSPVTIGSASAANFHTGMPPNLSSNWEFVRWLGENAGEVRVEPINNVVVNILLPLVPWFLILGFIWFFVIRQLRNKAANPAPMRVIVVNPGEK